MSDELEGPRDISPETVDKIHELYMEMSDMVDRLPLEAAVGRELALFFAVHVDENGVMDPPQDPTNTAFLRAIVALEVRIMRIESALKSAGLLK